MKKINVEKALIKKHYHGQKKYGSFSFVKDKRNMKEDVIDELIDAINYLIYQIVKDNYSELEILEWSTRKWNGVYKKLTLEIKNMSYRSKNPNRATIGKMYKIINSLQKGG